jgi:hypothetical protein
LGKILLLLATKIEIELVKAERNPFGSGVRVSIILPRWDKKKNQEGEANDTAEAFACFFL